MATKAKRGAVTVGARGPVTVVVPEANPLHRETALVLAKALHELARALNEPTAHVSISNCTIVSDGAGPALSVGNAKAA